MQLFHRFWISNCAVRHEPALCPGQGSRRRTLPSSRVSVSAGTDARMRFPVVSERFSHLSHCLSEISSSCFPMMQVVHWGGKSKGQVHKTVNLSQGIRLLADVASAELPTAGAHLHLQRSEYCFGSTSGWFFLIIALVNCLGESQIWDWICQFY